MCQVELDPARLRDRQLTDLERYLILAMSGSFKVTAEGELLFFPWRTRRGYVVPNHRQRRILQIGTAISGPPVIALGGLAALALLALGIDPRFAPLFFLVPLSLSAAWIVGVSGWCVLRLQRSPERLTAGERRAIKHEVWSPGLLVTLFVALLGGVTLGSSVVALQLSADGVALVLASVSALMLSYFAGRQKGTARPSPHSTA
jgi:hypothetical protein